ncbi:MAG: hypothetical protein AAF196_13290 [Planctomycetota bacterium]
MQIGRSNGMFPAPLYVALALSLLALAHPDPLRSIQRRLHGASSATVRWFLAHEASAAERPEEERVRAQLAEQVRGRVRSMLDRLESKAEATLHAADVSFGRPEHGGLQTSTEGMRGVVCRIIDRRSHGGSVDELVLDRFDRELEGSYAFVTVSGGRVGRRKNAEVLVGFLADGGVDSTDERRRPDPLARHARVKLMHHASGLSDSQATLAVLDSGSEPLRFLVEPAGVDALFPLSCSLWSDHQFDSKTGLLDSPVYSAESVGAVVPGGWSGKGSRGRWVPAGLRIGKIAIWGYQNESGVVAVQNFVEPIVEPESLATVTVWFPDADSRPDRGVGRAFLRDVEFEPVTMLRYRTPTASGRRLLAASSSGSSRAFPGGAAVVDGVRLLGRIETAGNGFGIVSPFGEPGDRQTFLFVPSAESRDPIEFEGEVTLREGDLVRLRVPQNLTLSSGDLFTGGGGLHYPSGLWIGPVTGTGSGFAVTRHRLLRDNDRRAEVVVRRPSGGRL